MGTVELTFSVIWRYGQLPSPSQPDKASRRPQRDSVPQVICSEDEVSNILNWFLLQRGLWFDSGLSRIGYVATEESHLFQSNKWPSILHQAVGGGQTLIYIIIKNMTEISGASTAPLTCWDVESQRSTSTCMSRAYRKNTFFPLVFIDQISRFTPIITHTCQSAALWEKQKWLHFYASYCKWTRQAVEKDTQRMDSV